MRALIILTLLLASGIAAAQPCPPWPDRSFPGADGFGAVTHAGRGGTVVKVTNLNNSGAGSLRQALAVDTGTRTVVFAVGGTITLLSPITITSGDVRVAGQTSTGIQIRNDTSGSLAADSFSSIQIEADDVILQHLRIRPGQLAPDSQCFTDWPTHTGEPSPLPGSNCKNAEDIQAIQIGGSTQGAPSADRVMLDHISAAWGTDSAVQLNRSSDVTVQRSLIAEGLNYHFYDSDDWDLALGEFAAKGITLGNQTLASLGERTNRVSINRNVIAHQAIRSPQLSGSCDSFDSGCMAHAANNYIYNARDYGIYATNVQGHRRAAVIGNYIKAGPDSDAAESLLLIDWTAVCSLPSPGDVACGTGLGLFAADNLLEDGGPPAPASIACRLKTGPSGGSQTVCTGGELAALTDTVLHQGAPLDLIPASRVPSAVLPIAGASRRLSETGAWVDARDAMDARVVAEAEAGTGAQIDTEADWATRAYPTVGGGTPYTDADNDGMADAWEALHGIAHSSSSTDTDGDGYPDLEEFLNGTDPTYGCAEITRGMLLP
jgi:hypothetical protein